MHHPQQYVLRTEVHLLLLITAAMPDMKGMHPSAKPTTAIPLGLLQPTVTSSELDMMLA